ncbi:MAG: hypothetical protein D6718_09420 [Acidobacteria bacterium]|nr:MAG: hypothetical protein D6718_09420 [Acidobacteriota bacterium]
MHRGSFEGRGRARRIGPALLLAALLPGCRAPQPARPVVAATVPPLAWLARTLAGPAVEVVPLVPPGARPETFAPAPARWAALSRTRVAVGTGHAAAAFEQRLLRRLREVSPRFLLVTPPADRFPDPHVWVDPRAMRLLAERLAGELGRLVPEARPALGERLARVRRIIDAAEAELRAAAARAPGRSFLVLHPVWSRLADRLGLREIPVGSGERTPGPFGLARALRRARRHRADLLLAQPQLPLAAARELARAAGVRAVVVDPLASDWPSAWSRFAAAIREGTRR